MAGRGEGKKKKSRTSPSHIQHPEHATCRSALRLLTFLINKIHVLLQDTCTSVQHSHPLGPRGAQGAAWCSQLGFGTADHTYHWILASGWVGDLIKSKLIVTRHNNFVITAGHSFTPSGT